MLCQFSFHNFRSYKSETTFDFQAATLPETPLMVFVLLMFAMGISRWSQPPRN